jgi:lipoprotein-releasing system ATP-binding protein
VADEIVRLDKVCKSYNIGQSSQTEILHSVDLTVKHGEFTALIGVSGSGKSTLLNIIGCSTVRPQANCASMATTQARSQRRK